MLCAKCCCLRSCPDEDTEVNNVPRAHGRDVAGPGKPTLSPTVPRVVSGLRCQQGPGAGGTGGMLAGTQERMTRGGRRPAGCRGDAQSPGEAEGPSRMEGSIAMGEPQCRHSDHVSDTQKRTEVSLVL